MKKTTLLEAVEKDIIRIGDKVIFDRSILPPHSITAVESKDSGYDEMQYISRESNKFYFVGTDDDGSLRFLAIRTTDSKIILKGQKGFENGLSIMYKICSDLYSNNSLGIFSIPLNKEKFSEYILREYEKNFIGRIISTGEAFLATPYISMKKQKDNIPKLSYGFKCFLGDVQLVNGTSEFSSKLGIVPEIKIYIPEWIYFDNSVPGDTPKLTSE